MRLGKQIASRNAEATHIAAVIADRLVGTVPKEFSVTVTNGVIGVLGTGRLRGNSFRARPAHVWLLPLSVEQRLKILFESYGRDLQSFLSRMQGSVWPKAGAESHVSVSSDTINVW